MYGHWQTEEYMPPLVVDVRYYVDIIIKLSLSAQLNYVCQPFLPYIMYIAVADFRDIAKGSLICIASNCGVWMIHYSCQRCIYSKLAVIVKWAKLMLPVMNLKRKKTFESAKMTTLLYLLMQCMIPSLPLSLLTLRARYLAMSTEMLKCSNLLCCQWVGHTSEVSTWISMWDNIEYLHELCIFRVDIMREYGSTLTGLIISS